MAVKVDPRGLQDAVRELFARRADDAVLAMLLDMEKDAPRRTGSMVNDITITENDSPTTIARHLRAPAEYASYQDEGVPGPILPVRVKALRFVASDGSEVFVKSTSGVPRTDWWTSKVTRWREYVARVIGH